MIPLLIRRCPECGLTGRSRRFAVVDTAAGQRSVECPSCNCRFEPVDDPWLN